MGALGTWFFDHGGEGIRKDSELGAMGVGIGTLVSIFGIGWGNGRASDHSLALVATFGISARISGADISCPSCEILWSKCAGSNGPYPDRSVLSVAKEG